MVQLEYVLEKRHSLLSPRLWGPRCDGALEAMGALGECSTSLRLRPTEVQMEDAHIVADAKVWRRSNVFDVHCLDVYVVVVAAAVVVVDAKLLADAVDGVVCDAMSFLHVVGMRRRK